MVILACARKISQVTQALCEVLLGMFEYHPISAVVLRHAKCNVHLTHTVLIFDT